MAPMTRTRATPERVPTPMMAEYYAQRASAGLIVTECVAVSRDSAGIIRAPGLYSQDHVIGWRAVTDAVHAAGGRIICQIWHGGRCSHTSLQPDGKPPVGASPVAADGLIFTPEGRVPYSVPRALEIDEIAAIATTFGDAVRRAQEAGFDGVELHAAYGYLPDQFLQNGSNKRTDGYGGAIANRARFLFQVVDAMTAAWSADRVGVKLSPSNTSYGITDSDPLATFTYAITGLSERGILYLHLMEPDKSDLDKGIVQVPDVIATFGPLFQGAVVGNCGFDLARANAAIAGRQVEAVSFGKLFVANPDLPARFATGAAFNPPDFATFYGEGPKGFIDHPTLALQSPGATAQRGRSLRALSYDQFGDASVLHFAELPEPGVGDADVLVVIEARSINLIDIRVRSGMLGPLVNKRFPKAPGADFAGTIKAVGGGVKDLKIGDRVFGAANPFRGGAFAERIAVPASQIARLPSALSPSEAAALPIAGLAALQSLRDLGGVKSGQTVLIHGATGPVGLYCVQLVKLMGGRVTAVGGAGLDTARQSGADVLIDYRSGQSIPSGERFDVILNASGKMPYAIGEAFLKSTGRLIEPSPTIPVFIGSKIGNLFRSRKHMVLATQVLRADLDYLAKVVGEGALKPVIAATFPFNDALAAFALVERGGVVGKVVVTQ